MAPFFLIFLFIICVDSLKKQVCFPIFGGDNSASCLPSEVIMVKSAWYGQPNASLCKGIKEGVCGASVVKNVKELCNGKRTCDLEQEKQIIAGVPEIGRNFCAEYGDKSVTVNYSCMQATNVGTSCDADSFQIITVQADQNFSWPGSKSNCTYHIKTAAIYLGMNLTITMMNGTKNFTECRRRRPILKIVDEAKTEEIVSNYCRMETIQVFHTRTNKISLTFMGRKRFIVGVRLVDLCKLGLNSTDCLKSNETMALYEGKNVTGNLSIYINIKL